jgi:hypothetical protein
LEEAKLATVPHRLNQNQLCVFKFDAVCCRDVGFAALFPENGRGTCRGFAEKETIMNKSATFLLGAAARRSPGLLSDLGILDQTTWVFSVLSVIKRFF